MSLWRESGMNAEDLRKLQLFEVKMLEDVVNVCEKNNITYYLISGTLLGAVRHKGFIPWDDDIDICMPYPDYLKFMKIGQQKLGSKYFLQTFLTDPNYQRSFARVRANHTAMLRDTMIYCHSHQGIWLDIFPLIHLGGSFDIKLKKRLVQISNYIQIDDVLKYNIEEFEHIIGKKGVRFLHAFHKIPMKIRQRIHKTLLHFVCCGKPKKMVAEVWGGITHLYPKEILDGPVSKVEFEGRTYNTFPDYIKFLECKYGDYMILPPVEERCSHGKLLIDLENDYSVYMNNPKTIDMIKNL